MKLKSIREEVSKNLIPYDGEVYYFENFLEEQLSKQFFQNLHKNIYWEHDEFLMYGKKIITKRKVAWYGSKEFDYSYSNKTWKARTWTEELVKIKQLIEAASKDVFNSCLLNLYHEGSEGMGWHRDNEKELQPLATIASLSLGGDRKFAFKHKATKETLSLTLHNGSLLLMKGTIQQHWLHQLPKTKKVVDPRINLTFRSIIEDKELI